MVLTDTEAAPAEDECDASTDDILRKDDGRQESSVSEPFFPEEESDDEDYSNSQQSWDICSRPEYERRFTFIPTSSQLRY